MCFVTTVARYVVSLRPESCGPQLDVAVNRDALVKPSLGESAETCRRVFVCDVICVV